MHKPQALEDSQAFLNKTTGFDLQELRGTFKSSQNIYDRARALYSEGLVLDALMTPTDQQSRTVLQLELAAQAGGQVKGEFMHPLLLEQARKVVQ